jgi:flagellin
MTVINTNVLSLVTQNNMKSSALALNSAIQRLSSGMRINSAKDDAAGQAIANRFSANIRGLSQASRNANDGISLAQTTEGALGEINNNLQRIRELSVQAANGSNSDSDLVSIQNEINERIDEINRTSEQTDFNGVKVLKDGVGSLTIQVGANDGETIEIDLQAINSSSLGLAGFTVSGQDTANVRATSADLLTSGFAAGSTDAYGVTTYTKGSYNAVATAADLFTRLATGDTVGVTGSTMINGATTGYAYNATTQKFTFGEAARALATVQNELTPTSGTKTATVTMAGGVSTQVTIDVTGAVKSAANGATLYVDAATGDLTVTNNGADPAATVTNLTAALGAAGTGGGSIAVSGGATYTWVAATATAAVAGDTISKADLLTQVTAAGGRVTSAAGTAVSGAGQTIAAGGANSANIVYLDHNDSSYKASGTGTLYSDAAGNVTNNAGTAIYNDARGAGYFTADAVTDGAATDNPLAVLDAALQTVDNLRGSLGAVQNRFDSVISNLGTTINNLKASRSRIEDADYATEVSNMSRAQILQQAGTSVLAQANQTTQGVLSLLR